MFGMFSFVQADKETYIAESRPVRPVAVKHFIASDETRFHPWRAVNAESD
jgi:hypothetical protein